MKEKKKFVESEMEFILFQKQDIIGTSGFEVGTIINDSALDDWLGGKGKSAVGGSDVYGD